MKALFRIALPFVLVGSLFFFVGCSEDDDDTEPTPTVSDFEQLAEAGDAYLTGGTKNITAEALWTELNDADATQPYVISIRSMADDTVRGRIPGAVHWEPADLIAHWDQLPADKKIVVYCYTGQTASYTTSYLRMMGFDAYNLKWGFCSWSSDTAQTGAGGGWYAVTPGGQTTETTAHPLTTEYGFPTVDCNAGDLEGMIAERCDVVIPEWKMKNASDVYANINDGDSSNDWFLCCYWAEANYNAGHIPGSFRFEPGSLGMTENLKYLPPNKTIVVYCYTGQTSAQVCTYLNMLGYDAYSMRYGMNAVTSDPAMLGSNVWTDLTPSYPVTSGGF
ncbi:rhodanese-like domain-containing protein [bacterium]|nr:rhodanese-like domain-containing protein [bacterium]